MAAGSLLALLDDISTVLDDVAVLGKVAAKKTAGVLGDDLALNAQQVSGVNADRELPVVWAVAKGSLVNKAILVPAALAISAFASWGVTALLMVGGSYLCYEGFEKLVHSWQRRRGRVAPVHGGDAGAASTPAAAAGDDPRALERDRVKGAVRTDFVLSAEIIAITLGTVADVDLPTQFAVLAGVALMMTVGVYGFVAAIVKLDDLGLWLARRDSAAAQAVGRAIVRAAPWLMKSLSVVGTAAMFLVGGGILVHGLTPLRVAIEGALHGRGAAWVWEMLANLGVGLVAGGLIYVALTLVSRLRRGAAG